MTDEIADKFDAQTELDLSTLRDTLCQMDAVKRLQREIVVGLRARSVPWEDIARALEISRQATQQRYSYACWASDKPDPWVAAGLAQPRPE